MDLNHSYFKHQILLMRAASARNCDARSVHHADARQLAAQIAGAARNSGARSERQWHAHSAQQELCA